jgi:hypothetical protein
MKTRLALRYFLSFGRRAVGFLALLVGTLGFVILGVDPMQWITPYLPIQYAGLSVDAAYVESLLATTQTNYVVLGSVVAVSLLLVLSAVILLVQSPKRAVKGFIRSPLSTFRGVVRGRNWLLAKVEYLNSESAKWRQTFNVLKSPYSLLRTMGFSPQMALGLIAASTTVGGGVIVNETILSERSFKAGDAGVYAAPSDIPVSYVSDPEEDGYNTLRIDLGATSVREITIENVSVGTVFTGSALPSGQQNVVDIGGNVISGGTNTRLEIGHLIFEKSRCKKLTLSDIQAHTLIVKYNASDGQSLAPSAGTHRMLAIGGGNQQADAMIHSGGTFDRIWINAPNSGVNGKIGTLRLSNLYTKGGECVLTRLTIGTLEILLNEIGMGNGFATKEFVIATNVTAANITLEDNVEVTIAEPATQ